MILVSACLVGENCRYDGKNCRNENVIAFLKDKEYQTICPEMMSGLSCPREPSERVGSLVFNKIGEDVTKYFEKGAEMTLELAKKVNPELIILQERSPSCGVEIIYDGTFTGKLIKGSGMTTQILRSHGFAIISSDYLKQNDKTNL